MNRKINVVPGDYFIPVSCQRLINDLINSGMSETEQEIIHQLQKIMQFQQSTALQTVKSDYLGLNPDNEFLLDKKPNEQSKKQFIEAIQQQLSDANYQQMTQQVLQDALEKTSPYGLELSVDFDQFEDLLIYYRGKKQTQVEVRDWKSAFLKKKKLNLMRYGRLFLLIHLKDDQETNQVYLKLFKNVLRADLEMLFPNSQVRMKLFDKLKLIVTGGGGTAGGLFAIITKLSAAASVSTILFAVVGFAMVIWRQVAKIFSQKSRYMKVLAENLYYLNLNNNVGVLSYLADQAAEEESKELILAYSQLKLQPVQDAKQLDKLCEDWFFGQYQQRINFDVSGALQKLEALQLMDTEKTGIALIDENRIQRRLNQIWRSMF